MFMLPVRMTPFLPFSVAFPADVLVFSSEDYRALPPRGYCFHSRLLSDWTKSPVHRVPVSPGEGLSPPSMNIPLPTTNLVGNYVHRTKPHWSTAVDLTTSLGWKDKHNILHILRTHYLPCTPSLETSPHAPVPALSDHGRSSSPTSPSLIFCSFPLSSPSIGLVPILAILT